MEYYFKALKINEELENKEWIAINFSNIGFLYSYLLDYPKAMEYNSKALMLSEELGDKRLMCSILASIGDAYNEQSDYLKALEFFFKALRITEELNDKKGIADVSESIGNTYLSIAKETNINARKILLAEGKPIILQRAKTYTESAIAAALEIHNLINLMDSYRQLSEIQVLTGDNKGALESYKNYSTTRDSVFNIEKEKKLTQTAMQYEFDKKEVATMAEQEKKDIQQRNIRNSIAGVLAGALLFLVVVYRQRNKIKAGKKRSDELLLNILPSEVAEELKATGATTAKDFDEVTVLFTDFKNFTVMSEKLTAQELVNEINYCYSAFDNIITKHGIEKIKTIGDSYMCAGGLPVANKTNAIDTVAAAIEIRDFMLAEKQKREAASKPFFEIRIGCNTGSVVAGIVGIKKFAYDIWGDTVNIASRMESSGEPGKINISGSTYELVKEKFTCEHRGKIEAKNKGEIDMYFPDLSHCKLVRW